LCLHGIDAFKKCKFVETWHTHSEMGITVFWSETLKVRGYTLAQITLGGMRNIKERSCNYVGKLYRLRIWSSGALIKSAQYDFKLRRIRPIYLSAKGLSQYSELSSVDC
jgi:hypothetical protein